jgi:hypothetical protein
MFVYEADVYWIERNSEFGRDKAEEERLEAEERKAMDFKTQRSEVIKLSANAQKKKQEESKELRQVDDTKVVDMEECMTELNARASSAQDMDLIKDNDADMHRRKVLPDFDLGATEPGLIFANGLQLMLPKTTLASESSLHDDRLTALLQKPARIKTLKRDELEDIMKSPFVATVARLRAEAAVGSKSYDEAELDAKRFRILNKLMAILKCRGRDLRLKQPDFEVKLGLPANSALSRHLFTFFLEGNQTGDHKQRKVDKAKTFCHLAVLALDLTLGYKLNFQPLREELGMDLKEMQDQLRYLGCDVNKSAEGGETKIEASLKAPLVFQPLSKGAGRGKRKRE